MPESTAYRMLVGLHERGVERILANGGTDFAPLIEAQALANARHIPTPRFITVPHEHTAVTAAHGAYLMDGRPQVVGVHHTVGTANTVSAVMTAARERIPLLLFAGRTPATESGHIGSRGVVVHWGTDTFDQGGMLREYTKWDHELRAGQCVEDILDRALDIAMTPPRGPVYLTLPREVLADDPAIPARRGRPRTGACASGPDNAALDELAGWLLQAERPVIITSVAGRDPTVPALLGDLAQRLAIPVVERYPRVVNLPVTHPFHAGYDPNALVADADFILVLECEVPWVPRQVQPSTDARIVHVGVDPLSPRIPVRSFPVDGAITGTAASVLRGLTDRLPAAGAPDSPAVARRRAEASTRRRARPAPASAASVADDDRIDPRWLSRCLHDVMDDNTILLHEYGLDLAALGLTRPGSFFTSGISGALGWTLAAAVGAKLAAPDRMFIAAMGDGSYVFGNPVACHFLAQAEHLPVLAVVINNAGYAAVRRAVDVVYPRGLAQAEQRLALADFDAQPSYEGVAVACGAWAEKVTSRRALPAQLAAGVQRVRRQHQQVLLNVICTSS
ncbi:MAG TPA: thiamine pyrophosphate-requiring protein [Nevskiaceae bacterium]